MNPASDGQASGAPSDNTTLTAVLSELSDEGWSEDATAVEGGRIRWSCGHEEPAGATTVGGVRRLEGASDPDDMLAVVTATCPRCGRRGVLVAQFGPMAGEADADVLAALPA